MPKRWCFRFHWLGWYHGFGLWKAENGLVVIDLWKFRFAFGRLHRHVGIHEANRRFERFLWR